MYHGELCAAATCPPPKPQPTSPTSAQPQFTSSFTAAAAAAAAAASSEQPGVAVGRSGAGGDQQSRQQQQPGEGILRRVEMLPLVADVEGGLEEGGGSLDEEEELRSMVCARYGGEYGPRHPFQV